MRRLCSRRPLAPECWSTIWATPLVSWALDRNDARARTDSHLDPGFLQWCARSNTSDRHMDQSGWTVVSGGAAWGLDSRLQGDTYIYVGLRLDLTTGATTEWLDGPPDRQFAPLGTDNRDRLYVSDGYEVWRLAQPCQVEHLLNPTAEGSGNSRSAWQRRWYSRPGLAPEPAR